MDGPVRGCQHPRMNTTPADHAGASLATRQQLLGALQNTLNWSARREYRGHEKHDGLNSPLLMRVCGGNRLARLVAIQAVMRSPVDLRRWLAVAPHQNSKGLALFAQAWMDLADLLPSDPRPSEQAREVLERLLVTRSASTPSGGRAWGYAYPWQDPGFYAAAGTPNAVVTSFVCEALLDAHARDRDPRWLAAVDQAVVFFVHDLVRLKDTPDELCLSYMPLPMRMRVMDVSILIASVLARHARANGSDQHMPMARRLLRYVLRQQTDYHAWWYTDPPGDSRIRHDNYHTGFILDALWRWMQVTGENEHAESYWAGLEYYRRKLFSDAGEPYWMNDQRFPYDVHGAAQGILTFARHADRYPGFAHRIATWTLANLYHPEGRFHYQKRRWHTRRLTFMRWCNGWMSRALAVLLKESNG